MEHLTLSRHLIPAGKQNKQHVSIRSRTSCQWWGNWTSASQLGTAENTENERELSCFMWTHEMVREWFFCCTFTQVGLHISTERFGQRGGQTRQFTLFSAPRSHTHKGDRNYISFQTVLVFCSGTTLVITVNIPPAPSMCTCRLLWDGSVESKRAQRLFRGHRTGSGVPTGLY